LENTTARNEVPDNNVIKLTSLEKRKYEQALQRIGSPYQDREAFLLESYCGTVTNLPRNVLRQILDFARFHDSQGVLKIENLPVDQNLPATPNDGQGIPSKQCYLPEGITAGISQLLGTPVGFHTEKSGDIIHNVVPIKQGSYTQSNQGSKVFLNFHNEFVYEPDHEFVPYNPDFLVLQCLRPDPKGIATTYFVEIKDVLPDLPSELLQELKKPVFKMSAPSTFTRDNGEKIWSKKAPVISGSNDAPQINLSANGVEATTDLGKKALEYLYKLLETTPKKKAVKLRQGEMVLINNRKSVHARGIFEPTFGTDDRWLQRCYIKQNIWDLRSRVTEDNRIFN